jgi:hypothetical protein
MAVSELVPEIAALDCAHVASVHERFSRHRFKELQVGGVRLVPAGEESIDCPQPTIG